MKNTLSICSLFLFLSILYNQPILSQIINTPDQIAKKKLPKRIYHLFNWKEIFQIKNDSLHIGWQVNLKDTTNPSDSSYKFLIMENANGVPISFYLNTVYYSLNTGEKRVIPKSIESTNLISKEKTFTNLWGPLGPPDTTIKGTDNICMPRCDTLSRLLLLPHKEDTVFKANRRYIPMINSFYLGIKNNPKSYSIGSLLKNSKPVRPLTNTISYIYLHPQGSKFSYIKELEVLDITRFKDIYVYNFFLWWTGSEYPQK